MANNHGNLSTAYNSDCAGQNAQPLTLGAASPTGASSSSTKLGGASRVGLSMIGVVGAGVVGGIAALL
jgi:hypothetical protein